LQLFSLSVPALMDKFGRALPGGQISAIPPERHATVEADCGVQALLANQTKAGQSSVKDRKPAVLKARICTLMPEVTLHGPTASKDCWLMTNQAYSKALGRALNMRCPAARLGISSGECYGHLCVNQHRAAIQLCFVAGTPAIASARAGATPCADRFARQAASNARA